MPVDLKLYKRIKKKVYKKIPKHSAYRSGTIVKEYKKAFAKKYGKKRPYHGKKTRKKGLSRWFNEKWRNQRGKVGYRYKSDIYRPTRRITKNTPLTFRELTKKQIYRARSEKRRTRRVKRFGRARSYKRYGVAMKERLIKIVKSTVKGKKYTAIVENLRTKKHHRISFGARGYEQYKDSTQLKLYAKMNHGDKKRRRNYFNRFSGIPTKDAAVRKELRKSHGHYNAKILSHIYLW
jgi:hypothetical protein